MLKLRKAIWAIHLFIKDREKKEKLIQQLTEDVAEEELW